MTAVLYCSELSSGIGYVRRADEALREGWDGLATGVGAMLLNLSVATGTDWIAMVSPMEGMDRFNSPAHLAAVWFCGDTQDLNDSTLDKASEPFRTGWTFEGEQTLEQGHPVPVLASFDGRIHQVLTHFGEGEPAQIFRLELDTTGESPAARHTSTDVAPDDLVIDLEVSNVEPTTAHLITLIIYTAMVSMIRAGLDETAALNCFQENMSDTILDDLGVATGEPSAICNTLVPYLQNPSDYLDEDDSRTVAKMCVMLLMSDGEPTEGPLNIARRVAASVGIKLP